jgi:hypothetical protein
MGSKKDILFYSNFCEYSNEVLNTIIRKNASDEFMLVCIDTNKFKLPSFVDRVPLVFTKQGAVISDESILSYINELYPSITHEIMPFSLQGGQDYTNPFSFIDDNDGSALGGAKGYTLLDQDSSIMMRPEAAPASNSEEAKKSKFDSSVFDKLVASRDNDLATFKKMYDSSPTGR